MEQLGRYQLMSRLSSGGMGELFLARQEGPAGFVKTVAIKRILHHHLENLTVLELFLNEARLAALLNHPNVVQVFDLGEANGAYFIVMEYLPGKTLRELEQSSVSRNLPLALGAYIVSQALHGIHHAHTLKDEQGHPRTVVHRDVSPENVLVTFDGRVKVVDFGLARVPGSEEGGTARRAGKWAYMAPEQRAGAEATPAVDIYAAGVMLRELGDQDSRLRGICQRALAEEPSQRFLTAEAMAHAVEEALTGDPWFAKPQATLTQWMREHFPATAPSDAVPPNKPAIGTLVLTALPKAPPLPQEPAKHASRIGVLVFLVCLMGAAALYVIPSPGQEPFVQETPKTAPPAAARPIPAQPDTPDAAVSVAAPVHKRGGFGKVEILVHPWGEVFEKDRSLGMTPMDPLSLSAGKHELWIKNPELPFSQSFAVQVHAGRTTTLRVNLYDELSKKSR